MRRWIVGVLLLWMAVLLVKPLEAAANGYATGCKVLVDRISGTEFVLNNDALQLANSSVQIILDCMPIATKVMVDIDEISTKGGIIIRDPITIQSTSDSVRLLCSEEGIKVRSSNVTLKGITIEGCKRNSTDAFIHTDYVDDILVEYFGCFDSTNERGPSCISGNHSSIIFRNISAIGNNGLTGGTLRLTNSRILIEDSTFQNNKALKDGGAVHMLNCDLNVTNTEFTANRAGEDSGAVAVKSTESNNSNAKLQGCNFTSNSAAGVFGAGGGVHVRFIESTNSTVGLQECNFTNNSAGTEFGAGGGVYVGFWKSNKSVIELQDSNFAKNSVGAEFGVGGEFRPSPDFGGGGGVGVGCNFANNSANADSGKAGGLAITGCDHVRIMDSVFAENRAAFGGSMFFGDVNAGNITSCEILGNAAKQGGGLYVLGARLDDEERKVWNISDSFFKNNSASEIGGGVCGVNGINMRVLNSTFTSNYASREGGALSVRSSSASPRITLVLLDSNLNNNIAQPGGMNRQVKLQGVSNSGGGALFFGGPGSLLMCFRSVFIGNEAGNGGAILGSDDAALDVRNTNMSGNSAILGGALACRNIKSTKLTQDSFENNSGDYGGALYAVGSGFYYASQIEHAKEDAQKPGYAFAIWISDTRFINNVAQHGGGALDVLGLTLFCRASHFSSNRVRSGSQELDHQGGGVRIRLKAVVIMRNSVIEDCKTGLGGGMFVEDAIVVGFGLNFTRNSAFDAGAAIAANVGPDFAITTPRPAECHACRFEGNVVRRAGIIYVAMEKMQGVGATSRHLLLNGTVFSGNVVESSGPLMLATGLNSIKVCCEPSTTCATGDDLLLSMKGSCCSERMQGQSFLGTFMQGWEISPKTIMMHSSGEVLETLTVMLFDAFNKMVPVRATVAITPVDDNVDLVIPPGAEKPFNGITNLTSFKLIARPGNYTLKVRISTDEGNTKDVEKEVAVHVRECEVGEHTLKNNRGCLQCLPKLYNFHPKEKKCEECPKNGECSGTTLTPLDAYWHHSSHSNVMLRCLNDNACTYSNRLDKLVKIAEDNLASGIAWDNGYPLCREGYEGILCGSCSRDVNGTQYGKNTSLDCGRCIENIWKGLYMVPYIIVLVFLTLLFVKGAKDYARETLSRGALLRSQAFASSRHQKPFPPDRQNENDVVAVISQPSPKVTPGDPSDVLKILVNFLQVSTLVTSFKLDWQGMMLRVIDAFDWLSGLASGAAYFAFSCAFQNPNRFIYANYLAIALPFFVWVGFAFVGILLCKARNKSVEELKTFWFVSVMAILDISYIGLTQKMAQVFYCTPVDLGNGRILHWAEDTSIACYKTSHKYLVMFAGAPLLVFVCLGFPITLFAKIYCRRRLLHSPVVVSRYGYFYQAYHAGYAYWNVLVQLRKALLAVISVVSLTFSEELKLYSASIVLLSAVALHTRCNPYKEQKLNRMETASLFISSFVCILQCMTLSPEANSELETALSVTILVLLVTFVAYMLVEIVLAYKRPMHDWFKDQDEYMDHTGGLISFLKVSSQITTSRFHSQARSIRSSLTSLASSVLSRQGSDPSV